MQQISSTLYRILQDEYVKAYYAALLKKQQELEEAATKQQELLSSNAAGDSGTSSTRQVGMKSKREEDEGDEDVEWEESNMNSKYLNAKPICLILSSALVKDVKVKL